MNTQLYIPISNVAPLFIYFNLKEGYFLSVIVYFVNKNNKIQNGLKNKNIPKRMGTKKEVLARHEFLKRPKLCENPFSI